MHVQPPSIPSHQFPIQELEQIESIIQLFSQWFATLEGRRAVLLAQLELIATPACYPRLVTKTIRRGFEYRGIVYEHRNCIDIHTDLLRRLWTDFPDRREAMARAMGSCGRKRTYVAKTRAGLFPGQPLAFANKHSRKLVDNWYIDTNLSSNQIGTIMLAALAAAGLSLGKDVKINWKRTSTS